MGGARKNYKDTLMSLGYDRHDEAALPNAARHNGRFASVAGSCRSDRTPAPIRCRSSGAGRRVGGARGCSRGIASMRIMASEARAYFDHETQRRAGMIDPQDLHDDGIEYFAEGGICGAFHRAHWLGVWMAHYGVKPNAWGSLVAPARAVLSEFWDDKKPDLVIGWTDEKNRAAIAFARRIGFIENGRMTLPSGAVIMQEWRP